MTIGRSCGLAEATDSVTVSLTCLSIAGLSCRLPSESSTGAVNWLSLRSSSLSMSTAAACWSSVTRSGSTRMSSFCSGASMTWAGRGGG